MNTPAERLQKARMDAGFSKASEAVERYNWVAASYYAHENGRRGITAETAKKYAYAFGVEVDWLLDGSSQPSQEQQSDDRFPLNVEAVARDLRCIAIAAAQVDQSMPDLRLFTATENTQGWWLHMAETLILAIEAARDGGPPVDLQAALDRSVGALNDQ